MADAGGMVSSLRNKRVCIMVLSTVLSINNLTFVHLCSSRCEPERKP